MKFTIAKDQILDVLSKVQGIAGRKSPLAITACLHISASGSEITISATDLETGFEGAYRCDVEVEGAVAVHARKLFEICRDFPSDEICLNEVDNHWIEISSGKVEYHLVGMNPEDFPPIPRLENIPYLSIDSAALKKLIEQTVFISSAPDERRPHFNGVLCEKIVAAGGEPRLRLVSTDGSRLQCVEHPIGDGAQQVAWIPSLVPKKGLVEVGRFLPTQGLVEVGIKDNHFVMRKASESIVIRLLEGNFPKYDEIIRQREDSHILQLDKPTFLMMLKRMSILSSDNYKGVIFTFADNRLTIVSTNPDLGESKEELEIAFEGKPVEAAFNPKFFIDAIGVLDEGIVQLHLVDGEKPCLVRGEGNDRSLCVIMPMRI
jgi:DNA polymerase-3 subunit beta